MVFELLPRPIQEIYAKMHSALSMRGYLDALQELLDELEWNSHTKKIYLELVKRMGSQDKDDGNLIEEALKWVKGQFASLRKGRWKNKKAQDLVLIALEKKLAEIEAGDEPLTNYLQGMVSLFQKTAELTASFCEFDALQGVGTTKVSSVSLSNNPLKDRVVERKTVEPFSEEGKLLMSSLQMGFRKAEVLPPVNEKNLSD